ncbi:MAG: helix-turn-helix transcriptional regulator, partial [Spirochaetales bacterium]
PEYISGLFKKETGITYGAYIKKIRMEEAKRCLEQTNMKIFEIAFRVGYSDFGYFSKVFKSYTGFSPKDYVKHHTKK